MRRRLALLGIAAVAALATPAHALEVYRWIEGATVVYSDQPPPTGAVLTSLRAREALGRHSRRLPAPGRSQGARRDGGVVPFADRPPDHGARDRRFEAGGGAEDRRLRGRAEDVAGSGRSPRAGAAPRLGDGDEPRDDGARALDRRQRGARRGRRRARGASNARGPGGAPRRGDAWPDGGPRWAERSCPDALRLWAAERRRAQGVRRLPGVASGPRLRPGCPERPAARGARSRRSNSARGAARGPAAALGECAKGCGGDGATLRPPSVANLLHSNGVEELHR